MKRNGWLVAGAAVVAVTLGACGSDVGELTSTGSCPGCNLNRTDLEGEILFRADLSEANLRRADLRGIDLEEAQLQRAQLPGADLRQSILMGTNLSRANLVDADLRGADLRRSDFSFADLRGADLRDVEWGVGELEAAIADEIPFLGELVREVIIDQSDLAPEEIFTGDNPFTLDGLDLEEEGMVGRIAVSALLFGTTIAEAELQEAIAPVPNFEFAIYDRTTRFPANFDPEAANMRLRE